MQRLSRVKDSQKPTRPNPEPPTLLYEDKQARERKREIDGGAWRPEEAEEDGGARVERSRDKGPG